MAEPVEYVLTYAYLFKEETEEFPSLAEAEAYAEGMSEYGEGFPKKITLGEEVIRDYVQEFSELMKSQGAVSPTAGWS